MYHGKEGSIKIGPEGGPADQLVAKVYEWEFGDEAPIADGTAMRDTAQAKKGGIPGATGSLSCRYDPADLTGQGALKAGARFDFELYPLPDTSGNPVYSGTAVVSQRTRTGTYQDMIDVSFEFEVDGDWTETTVV